MLEYPLRSSKVDYSNENDPPEDFAAPSAAEEDTRLKTQDFFFCIRTFGSYELRVDIFKAFRKHSFPNLQINNSAIENLAHQHMNPLAH